MNRVTKDVIRIKNKYIYQFLEEVEMRTQFLSKCLVLFLFCGLAASQAYGADTGKYQRLETALQSCKGKARTGECVDALWSIADIAKDGALSPAEISRVIRLILKSTNETNKDQFQTDTEGGGKNLEEFYGYLLGPLFSYFLFANYDYNADGKLTLQEIGQDLTDKKIVSLLAEFNSVKNNAASKLPTGLLPELFKTTPQKNTPTIKRKNQKPKQKITVATKRKKKLVLARLDKRTPLELVSWNAEIQKGDFSQYYKIQYELRNKLGKGIKLIDGKISFYDLLGKRIFRISITRDLHVAPDATVKNSGRYNITFTSDLRLRDLPKDDVRVKLHIRQLVLEDNSVVKYK